MSSIVHKVKSAIGRDDTDDRYGNSNHRTHHESNPYSSSHHADDDYGTSTTTTTGTTTHVMRSRTPAANDEYDTNLNNTTSPISRVGTGHSATGHSNFSPTTNKGLAATSARSEPPPLPGREPPTVPGRRNETGSYVPTTDTHTGPTGAHIGTSGDRIGEAVTGKPSVPHTGTYNHTSDNRGLVDRSKLMDPASKDAGSNVMSTNGKIISPATSADNNRFSDNNQHGSIHDLRKSHEKRDDFDNDGVTDRNNNSIFGVGRTNDNRNEYDHQRNTLGDHTHGHHHNKTGLTAQERDNRDSNIAGTTGALGLAANSSINRRAVGGANSNRDSLISNDTAYRDDPAIQTHLNTATTGTTLPQGTTHNGVIGHGSARESGLTGHDGLGRTTGTNSHNPTIPAIIPSVGPAPKTAATNDRRFNDDDDDRFGNNGNSFNKNNTRYGNGTGAFNDSRFGDSRNNNTNVDGVSLRDNSNRRHNDGVGRNTDEFGRVVNSDNNNRSSNLFDRDNDNYGRDHNTFGRNTDNYNRDNNTSGRNNDNNFNRNSGGVFDNNRNTDNNFNRNSSGVFDNSRNNDNFNRNNDTFNRNNDSWNDRNNDNYNNRNSSGVLNNRYNENYNRNDNNYGRNYNDGYNNSNNRFGNNDRNQPWGTSGPKRSGTGSLVTGVFGNPGTGLDHHGPGYNGSKVMHECDHCGHDNDITHYFRKEAVYRLHRA